MPKLVALDNKAHQHLNVDPVKAEEMIADLHMLPVVINEFQKLVVEYPILFSKNAETGQFVCVVLMGFEEGENLFWQSGAFNSLYTPLNIARHPFFIGQDEYSGDNHVMCIDTESDALSEHPTETTEPLFNSDGSASQYLQSAQTNLAQLLQGEQQTQQLTQALLQLDLLVPLALDITFEKGSIKQVKGLYSVDEEKLSNLSAESLYGLQQKGFLQAIYTQLASLGQIYALIDKKNKRELQTSPWFKASGE